MYRYSDDKWNALPTRKTGEDDQYMYFESKTPGFSPIAIITGMKAVEYKENESEESTEPLIGSNQSKVPETVLWPSLAAEDKDWSGTSSIIKVLVGFMVILLIGLAVKEKRNDKKKFRNKKRIR